MILDKHSLCISIDQEQLVERYLLRRYWKSGLAKYKQYQATNKFQFVYS